MKGYRNLVPVNEWDRVLLALRGEYLDSLYDLSNLASQLRERRARLLIYA